VARLRQLHWQGRRQALDLSASFPNENLTTGTDNSETEGVATRQSRKGENMRSAIVEDNAGTLYIACQERDRAYVYPQEVWPNWLTDLVMIAEEDDLSDWTLEAIPSEDWLDADDLAGKEGEVIAEYDGHDITIHVRRDNNVRVGGGSAHDLLGIDAEN
jgi:hypothetical protein